MVSDMQTIVKVVEKGSFTAAADDMGKTPSAVSRIVSRLEERLGVRLLHRTTRRILLTSEGELYYKRSKQILAEIVDTETEVSKTGQTPHGQLRVTCLTGFALHALAETLPAFQAQYPDVQLILSIDDGVKDLIKDEFDVGIRSGVVTEPSLVARQITQFERHIFAAPDYLARKGTPETPWELQEHTCIIPQLSVTQWDFKSSGEIISVKVPESIVTDSAEMALRLAIAGGGIVLAGNLMTARAVEKGELVPILLDYHTERSIGLSVVYPYGRLRMPKVRAFIDFLVKEFRG